MLGLLQAVANACPLPSYKPAVIPHFNFLQSCWLYRFVIRITGLARAPRLMRCTLSCGLAARPLQLDINEIVIAY